MGTAVALHAGPISPAVVPQDFKLRYIVEEYGARIAPYLTGDKTPERVLTELYFAAQKSPHLDECKPEALVHLVCRALDTGGVIGVDVYLVAFKNKGVYEPTLMIDYKFEAQLVKAAGGARGIHAHVVREGELFEVQYGTSPSIRHQPVYAGKPGKIIGAYAWADHGQTSAPTICWLTMEQIETIRKGSKQWGPDKIRECPEWYGPKSAVHRVVKLLPKSPKLAKLMAIIDTQEREEFDAPIDDVSVPELASGPSFLDETLAPALTRDSLLDFGSESTRKLRLSDVTGDQLAQMLEYKARIPEQWHTLLEQELEIRETGVLPNVD